MNNQEVLHELIRNFGEGILDEKRKPDRKKLASVVFSNSEQLEILNGIIHPRVKTTFDEWVKNQKSDIVIREAAILIESGALKDTNKLILVVAPEEVRIRRVLQRDETKEEEVRKRMKNQMAESEKLKYADFVINNDGIQAVLPQVLNVLNQLHSPHENTNS